MILDLATIQAQLSPELGFLRFQWNPVRPGLAGFRRSMLTIAQLLEQGAVELVLLDMNKLPSLGLEEQFWVATSWLPTVSVPVLQRVALVLPQTNMYNQMVVESVLRTGQPFIHYDIQFFTDAAGAMDWLVGQVPAQLAALETEWHHYNPVLMQPA